MALLPPGHPEEQTLKLDRSGLGVWFGHTAIVKEKDVASYRSLVGQLGWPAERTWMVGNSPKSDINPALEAGLNAVFVPHERTWTLERQPLREEGPGRLEVVREFAALRSLF